MGAVLIIFISFHFDAGASSTKIDFDHIASCEEARYALLEEAKVFKKSQNWGRTRVFAACIQK